MISINQRGAGNGKTYDSISKIATESEYGTFVYLAKTHSSIFVIKSELEAQYVEYNVFDDGNYKQYVYYIDQKLIIIGTVDSFNYALHSRSERVDDEDFCRQFRKTILNGHTEISANNNIRYSQKLINLDNTLIILDEAQDLHSEYLEVFMHLNLKVYVIGDLLQSLYGESNIMSAVQGVIPINYKDNIVRRFNSPKLMEFVNKVAEFKKYDLPPIVGISPSATNIGDVKLLNVDYSDASNEIKAKLLWIQIQMEMEYLVQVHNYGPENFMFIFPIMNKQQFPILLQTNVDMYWKSKLGEDKQYCFLHKSEDSKPIDFNESAGMSKILSIHASKGSGCEVVFAFDLTMAKLDPFKEPRSDLRIDSMIHVAITRSKNYLVLAYTNTFSDCHVKRKIVSALNGVESREVIFMKNSANSLINTVRDMYLDIKPLIPLVVNSDEQRDTLKKPKLNVVDWNHHIIRSNVMEFIALFYMASLKKHNYNSDLMVRFTAILRLRIHTVKCPNNEFVNTFNYMSLNSKTYLSEIQKLRRTAGSATTEEDEIDLYEDDIDNECTSADAAVITRRAPCVCNKMIYGKRAILTNIDEFEQALQTSNCWLTPCKISHNVLFVPYTDHNVEDVTIFVNIANRAIEKFKSLDTFKLGSTIVPNLNKIFCVFEMTVLTFLMKFGRNCERVLYEININDLLNIIKKRKNTKCSDNCCCCINPTYVDDPITGDDHYTALVKFDELYAKFVNTLSSKSNFKQHISVSSQVPYYIFVDRFRSSIIPFIEYDNVKEGSTIRKILKSLIYFTPSLSGFNLSKLVCDIVRDIVVLRYSRSYENDKKITVKSDNEIMHRYLYLYIKNMGNDAVKAAHTKLESYIFKTLKKLNPSFAAEYGFSDSLTIHVVTLCEFQTFTLERSALETMIGNIKTELTKNLFNLC